MNNITLTGNKSKILYKCSIEFILLLKLERISILVWSNFISTLRLITQSFELNENSEFFIIIYLRKHS